MKLKQLIKGSASLPKIFIMVLFSIFLKPQTQSPPDDVVYTDDNCIDGQDLNSADIGILNCPAIPVEHQAT